MIELLELSWKVNLTLLTIFFSMLFAKDLLFDKNCEPNWYQYLGGIVSIFALGLLAVNCLLEIWL